MKKAFVSYSVNVKDELVIVLLSSQLQKKKMTITASNFFYPDGHLDFISQRRIQDATFFLGVITSKGQQNNSVIEEYKFAVNNGVPHLLLVEDEALKSVRLPPEGNNKIQFNRQNPKPAIDYINNNLLPQNNQLEEALPWVLGGTALIAAIGLLSGKR